MLAIAWDYAVPTKETAHITKRPPLPEWYLFMDAARDLNANFFELAGIPINDFTRPIVTGWALLKRQADARASRLMRPRSPTKGYPVQ